MDRILFIDAYNFIWLANVSFKPKKPQPIIVEGYENTNSFEAPVSTEIKPVPPENVLIFNFFRNLRALVDPFAPHKIVFVLEGYPAFRYELYADYKANRIIKTASPSPSDTSRSEAKERFDKAKPEILRLLKMMPITQMKHPDYEADDVIGALVEDSKEDDVIVVSNDSDYVQLTQMGYKQFRLYSPSKKTMIQPPDYHYLTWKILHGDKKTDNIPGMMGDKTAQKLCKDPEKLKAWLAIEENAARFRTNKLLIEFAKVPLEELEVEEGITDWDGLKQEFERLDFQSMIKPDYWKRFQKTFKTVKF